MNCCSCGLAALHAAERVAKSGVLPQTLNGCWWGAQVPEGVDCLALCKNAMDKYSVEIAGGLGPSAGKVWRVGIMVSRHHFRLLRT